MDSEYNHDEAYCLMTYKCQECKRTEVLWNSRDGVTPFIINCEKCNGQMQHVNWNQDVRNKNYIPKIGQRVFIDTPIDAYKVMMRTKAKYIKEHVDGNMDTLQRIYNGLMKEYKSSEPYIIKV